MKALHITNWYPSGDNPHKVPFIKEHLMALQDYCENTIVHVEVQDDSSYVWKKHDYEISSWEHARLILTKKIPWRVKEYLSHRLLIKVLDEFDVNRKYDILNIHTAYPLCTKTKSLLAQLSIPLVFTEHWTAFHFNFNLPQKTKKLDRIKEIYRCNIPLITVSEALKRDISEFAGAEQKRSYVVPNVVDSEVFKASENEVNYPTFFMLNYWRSIKSPFVVLKAFDLFLKSFPTAKLRIGGYGPLWEEMENYVLANKLEENITLLGYQTKIQSAREMQNATAFVHAASYETFSVVTAESLMCGTPVIVSRIPAIEEFVNQNNGILVDGNEVEVWVNALTYVTQNPTKFDRKKISAETKAKFSKTAVGKTYYDTLLDIRNQY